MIKRRRKLDYSAKEIIIAVAILLGGIGLSVMSFCLFYLIEQLSFGALIAICVIDVAYMFFELCVLMKHGIVSKWALKAVLFSLGYIALFMVVAVLFTLVNGSVEFVARHIVDIVYYAFFTGPCIFIVVPLFILILAYGA